MVSKLKFILKYTHQYKWWYLTGIIFMGLTLWVSVTIPEYLQKCIDLISDNNPESKSQFYNYVFMILGLAVVLIIIRTLSRTLFFLPGRYIEKQLKGEMYRKLSSLGKKYFDKNEKGSILSIVNNDVNGVRMVTGFGIMQVVNILFAMSLTPYKMWQLSWELTLYCFVPVIITFIVVRIGMIIMVKNMHLRMADLQNLSGKTVSFLSGTSVIKSYLMHKWAEKQFQKENESLLKHTLKIAWVRSFIMPLLGNLEQILKIIVLLIGGIFVIQHEFTLGELTAFIAYATLLTMPIMGFGWVLTIFQQGFVGISSIQTILNKKSTQQDLNLTELDEPKELFNGILTVKNLSYKYHDGEYDVLKNISFDIEPGKIIGITGPVGSGKTTLINCLNRYLDYQKGEIFFNGIDAKTIKNEDIRSVVRTVSQDVFLFSDTIENNIIFGSDRYDEKSTIDKVIYKSSLLSDVNRFPKKDKTLVGEKGIMLSGGQKQRICLARALYTPCDLLILDDIFSAVDTETERFLISQIVDNKTAKSILIVSNRISVLEKTDHVIILMDGKITQQGTHEEMLELSDFYKNTSKLQENKRE